MGSALLKSIILIFEKCNQQNKWSLYFFIKSLLKKHKLHLSHLFCCNHTCFCVYMVSMTSRPHNITSASHYHPRYQSKSLMYIRGPNSGNLADFARVFEKCNVTVLTNLIIKLPWWSTHLKGAKHVICAVILSTLWRWPFHLEGTLFISYVSI